MSLVVAVVARIVLALQPAPAAAEAPTTDETVLWFGSGGTALDGAALLDAVAVYTRDLRLSVRTVPAIPLPGGADGATATLRSWRARLGFWCERTDRRSAVLTTIDRAGHVEAHTVEEARAGEPELYRAIALKLRTALVAAVGTEVLSAPPAATTPPPAPNTAGPPATTAAAVAAVSPNGGATPARPRPFVAVGYRLSAPAGEAPLRNALWVEGTVAVGRALEVGLLGELAPRATGHAGAGSLSVLDVPLALTARLVARRARFSAGGGPFAAVHLLWASATAPGGAGANAGPGGPEQVDSFSAQAGVGVEAVGRLRLGARVAVELRAAAELALPATRYWVRNAPTLDVGSRVGLGLGLAFPAP